MNQYKYFSQEGSVYKYKSKTIFKIVIFIAMLGLSLLGLKLGTIWLVSLFGILALMVGVAIFTDKFEIDTQNKVLEVKDGVFIQNRIIPFDKIVTFEMLTTTTNFVRSSVQINLYYLNDKGKEKVVKVAQGISKTHMQNILNEVDEILDRE